MFFFFWCVNIMLSLAISALAVKFFMPAVKRLLARAIPADILSTLAVFAVLAVFVAGIMSGAFGSDLVAKFNYVTDWEGFFYQLCEAVIKKVANVLYVLAYVFAVAIAAYVLSPKWAGREGAGDQKSEPLT